MAGLLGNFDDEPQGLLAGLQRGIGNPMTMAGLGLLSGGGWNGAARGMQMGAGFEDQRRQDAERKRMDTAYRGLLQDPDVMGQMSPAAQKFASSVGVNPGLEFLATQAFPAPAKPTDDQREYAQAKQQGFGGSFMDYLQQVKGFSRPTTTVNMPPMEKEYDKTMGGELAKEFVEAQKIGGTAQRDIATLNTMRQALDDPNLYTGTGGNFIQGLKKGAETLFGVPVKGTNSGEIMQSIGAELALSNRDKLPGPMSNADREFLMNIPANITKSPEANRLLIGLAIEGKQWQIARAQVIRDYAAKNGGRLDANVYAAVAEIDNDYAQKSASVVQRLRGFGEMAPRSPTVGVPNAYKEKYGLE